MQSPIDFFLEWYQSIPIAHREDIAVISGLCLPGYESIEMSEPLDISIDKFISITKSAKGQNFKEIGTVISLRSFIQFFFIDKRSDRSGWKETEVMLKHLAEAKNSETFEKMSREVKFKAEQWIATCAKWEQLVLNHISNEQLRNFQS